MAIQVYLYLTVYLYILYSCIFQSNATTPWRYFPFCKASIVHTDADHCHAWQWGTSTHRIILRTAHKYIQIRIIMHAAAINNKWVYMHLHFCTHAISVHPTWPPAEQKLYEHSRGLINEWRGMLLWSWLTLTMSYIHQTKEKNHLDCKFAHCIHTLDADTMNKRL